MLSRALRDLVIPGCLVLLWPEATWFKFVLIRCKRCIQQMRFDVCISIWLQCHKHETKTSIHSIYWKNIKSKRYLHDDHHLQRISKHTTNPIWFLRTTKKGKTQRASGEFKNQLLFCYFSSGFLPFSSRCRCFFFLRARLEGDVHKGGQDHEIHDQRRDGYQHHDTCFRGEHRHIDDQAEQNSKRQGRIE